MIGLAWDALWHAFISPQQAEDNKRRQWMDEADRLLNELEIDFSIPESLTTNEVNTNRRQLLCL